MIKKETFAYILLQNTLYGKLLRMIESIAILAVLILSIIAHEVAHGWMANWLGDPTAKLQGRLSPNPLKHIDPVGSVIVPGLLYFLQTGFLFGWAKPVPYNPYNIRSPFGWHHKWADVLVAFAGPATNIMIALVFVIVHRLSAGIIGETVSLISTIVFINVLLAFFNLIPIPPLDGSKILGAFLPHQIAFSYEKFVRAFESYGMLASFAFLFIFIQFLSAPFFAMISWIMAVLLS